MRPTLNVFIGFDSKEPAAFHVLAHSILTRATCPVAIRPLVQSQLRAEGCYTRERGPTESTEFSLTRFLVPYLSGYTGFSVFMDSDMLCRVDLQELWPEIQRQCFWGQGYAPPLNAVDRDKALLCCQHDYQPADALCGDCDHVEGAHNIAGVNHCAGNLQRCECRAYVQRTKFLGHVQTAYPRKNWSSFMVFDNARCKVLTPDVVNTATGLFLHRLQWLPDAEVGSLPLSWNWLLGEYAPSPQAKVLHWTLGGPWWEAYRDADCADEWRAERSAAMGQALAVA